MAYNKEDLIDDIKNSVKERLEKDYPEYILNKDLGELLDNYTDNIIDSYEEYLSENDFESKIDDLESRVDDLELNIEELEDENESLRDTIEELSTLEENDKYILTSNDEKILEELKRYNDSCLKGYPYNFNVGIALQAYKRLRELLIRKPEDD